MDRAAYFTERAAQYRRLAAAILDRRAIEALSALAEEFEVRAAAGRLCEGSEACAQGTSTPGAQSRA